MRFGQQAIKLAVLQFEFAQPFGLSCIHAAVLGAPFIESGITKAVFAADLLDRHTGFGLPQKANDQLFAVLLVLMPIILHSDGLLGKMTSTVYAEQISGINHWLEKLARNAIKVPYYGC